MSDVKVSSLAATIEMLGASLSIDSSTAGAVKVKGNCGTIALINQIISDLSSLRTTLRDAEKEMQKDLRLSMIRDDGGGAACNDIDTPDLTGVKIGRANKEHAEPTGTDNKSRTDGTGIAHHWQDGAAAGTNFVTSGALLETERQGESGVPGSWPGLADGDGGSATNTGKVGIKLGSSACVAEQAIMNVLVDVYGVVDKLKNGSSIVVTNNYKASLE